MTGTCWGLLAAVRVFEVEHGRAVPLISPHRAKMTSALDIDGDGRLDLLVHKSMRRTGGC